VYNKSLLKLLQNHQILYKAIRNKFFIYLNKDGFLSFPEGSRSAFGLGVLSATDIDRSYLITDNNFVHSNEIVAASVINRALEQIYNLETDILELISPRIFKELPNADNNIINPLSGVIIVPPLSTVAQPLTWIVNITKSGGGSSTTYPSGSAKFIINQPAVIQAISDGGYDFSSWTGDNMTKLTILSIASGGSTARIDPGADFTGVLNYTANFI
jgi:hypothetical protein